MSPQRSNYSEPSAQVGEEDEDGKYTKGRARQLISEKRAVNIPGVKKKKSSMNVRTALLYRKNFSTLVEESVRVFCPPFIYARFIHVSSPQNIASLPATVSTYLTAQAPAPTYPPRLICSVCGYWGRYKCRRCALPFCDRNCEGVHAETRCERRVV